MAKQANYNTTDFWKWFTTNHSKYLTLDDKSERECEKLMDEFLEQLHRVSDGLFFQISSNQASKAELIITADGDIDFFEEVEKLVQDAPNYQDWEVIAFKPAQGTNFTTNYEGLEIDPKVCWFLPLEKEDLPDWMGLRIGIPNYSPSIEKQLLAGTYQMLDTILGEKSSATNIQYVEVDALPENPDEEGFIELKELPAYINWKNK